MEYNWVDQRNKNDLLSWFVVAAITKVSAGKNPLEKFAPPGAEQMDPRHIDVRMTINGVEVPVKEVFEGLSSHWDYMIDKAAKELVEDKLGTVFNELDAVSHRIRDLVPSNWQSSGE